MIRTQIYIDESLHRDLIGLAKQANEPMAQIARDILREGVKKRKKIDYSGKTVMRKLLEMKITGGDDPYLSENIDHYLYGAPKKRV